MIKLEHIAKYTAFGVKAKITHLTDIPTEYQDFVSELALDVIGFDKLGSGRVLLQFPKGKSIKVESNEISRFVVPIEGISLLLKDFSDATQDLENLYKRSTKYEKILMYDHKIITCDILVKEADKFPQFVYDFLLKKNYDLFGYLSSGDAIKI